MNIFTSTMSTLGAGLPDIQPRFDAPWMPTLNNAASWFLGTFLVALIIGLGVGVIVWIFGKLSSSGRAQDVGISFMLWTVIAAALLAGAAGFISWGMGLPLF